MTTTRSRFAALTFLAALISSCAVPAMADGFDEGQAKSRMEAAGYGDVGQVHQGNIGDWMAQGTRDGRRVMIVLHPDGKVELGEQMDLPPVQPAQDVNPAKP